MKYLLFFMILVSLNARYIQRSDILDDCDWCRNKAKYTQPLDFDNWRKNCQKKPKQLWFTFQNIGRVYGSYNKSITNNWLYSQKLGWIYNVPTHKGYFYTQKWQWIYIKDDMIYFFKDKRWDYLININS